MTDMKQIHHFAVKWCDKFRDRNINYIELVDHYMADDCDLLALKWTVVMPFRRNTVMQQIIMRLWIGLSMM